MRDPRYDILFVPMRIGSVTSKNRFYQAPHCNGGGYHDPSAAAEMRGIKAEWADAGIKSVKLFGDAEVPRPIKWSTYAGHRYACDLDGENICDALPSRHEITEVAVG